MDYRFDASIIFSGTDLNPKIYEIVDREMKKKSFSIVNFYSGGHFCCLHRNQRGKKFIAININFVVCFNSRHRNRRARGRQRRSSKQICRFSFAFELLFLSRNISSLFLSLSFAFIIYEIFLIKRRIIITNNFVFIFFSSFENFFSFVFEEFLWP